MDPAALQVLISRLTGIAEEMGAVLQRAAFSPNIKERADCSAALFTAGGELLVQAEHIPVHLGSMPAAVRAAIDACGDVVGPGDQIIAERPVRRRHASERRDARRAVLRRRRASSGWAANRAHHADLGGMAPGSMPPDAVHIAQEGLRIPPVVLSDGVAEVLVASSRTPEERRGDLDAQVGANRLGVTRLAELAGAPFDEIVDYGERRMRAALRALPGRTLVAPRTCSTPPARARSSSTRRASRSRSSLDGRRGDVRLHRHRRPAARHGERGRGGDRERGRVRVADRDRSDDPGERRRVATGARRSRRPARSSRPSSRPRSARATSRSASASPTCACARSRRSRPTGSVPRARER